MRITALVSSLRSGGAERVMAGLVNEWSAKGHQVTLITLADEAVDFYPIRPEVARTALGVDGKSANIVTGALRTFGRIWALRKEIVRSSPDVVVSFVDRMNVLALLATVGVHAPLVVSERVDPAVQGVGVSWGFLRRIMYPRAAALVVQTEGAARWAQAHNRRVEIIPNPLILSVTGLSNHAPPDWKRPIVIAVGRFRPQKDFRLLVRAFAHATVHRKEWHLAFLGDGPERTSVEACVRELGLERRVHFVGRVVDPAPYLLASDIFALSSLFEGFPNALLEGLAAGLPAVATDCRSGPRDLIEEGVNGMLVPVGDVERFADALSRLMGDDTLRARLALGARSVAARYPLDAIAARWIELFGALQGPGGES